MKHRDYTNRIVRVKGGLKTFTQIERQICPKCKLITRNLPNYLLPYKHYEKEIIFGVKEGLITPETLGYEDYPCEMTMIRWRRK